MKRSLSEVKYKKFAKMIQDYTKTGNFEELLEVLGSLFPPKELFHLFIGIPRYKDYLHCIINFQ